MDASVWVSSAYPPDQHHVTSRAWLYARLSERAALAAPEFVLAELGGAISRRSGSPIAAYRAIRQLRTMPTLRLEPMDDALHRASFRLATDLGLRGADAVYVAVAERLKCRLVTWDADMMKRAAGLVDVRPPTP